jgi:hypothetical protein
MNLFNAHYPPNPVEDVYRELLEDQFSRDKQVISDRGVIPDWMGEPRPLDKSLARVLNWTYENGCFEWSGVPSNNNRKMTGAFGFRSSVNAHEAVSKCHSMGLLETYVDKGATRFQLTQAGEYALEEWELEVEIMGLDVSELIKEVDVLEDEIGGMFS